MSKIVIFFGMLLALLAWLLLSPAIEPGAAAQQPTVAIATVTGTPLGPMVTVYRDQTQIYVRSGPGQNYPVIGVLVAGQRVPAYGVSQDDTWIQIGYLGVDAGTGWVHKSLVGLSKPVPFVDSPPTPTPRVTATLDPTLSALVVNQPPTRIPTFTSAPPLAIPTFTENTTTPAGGGLPIGFIIAGLAVIGLFGTMLSILRGR